MGRSKKLKPLNKNLLGKVAIISDSNEINTELIDILEVLRFKKLDPEVINLSNLQLTFSDSNFWEGISCVWINIISNKLFFGSIQGFLEVLGINYTGTGILSAALSADQAKAKKIWQITGIATTPFIKWQEPLDWQEILGLIGLPLAVKSSNRMDNRIFKITNLEQIKDISSKFDNSTDLVLEPWITGDRYIVYIINGKALYPLKMMDKFADNSNPNQDLLPDGLLNFHGMQKLALDAFMAIGGQCFGAVSILQDVNGDCWVSSIDFSLSLNRNSDFAVAAYKSGITFEELIESILNTSFVTKSKDILVPTF